MQSTACEGIHLTHECHPCETWEKGELMQIVIPMRLAVPL